MPDNIENVVIATRVGQAGYDVGAGVIIQAGTFGNTFNTGIKRYARTASGGYIRLNDQIDPRSVIDPRYGAPDLRVRARDTVAIGFPNGTTIGGNTIHSRAFWGFGGMPNALSSSFTTTIPMPFVGFRMHYDVVSGVISNNHVWRCTVVGDNCAVLHETTTAVDVQTPHELTILLDGPTSTVFWLIDQVVVDSYTFATNTAPGQVNPYASGSSAGSWNLVIATANDSTGGFTQILYYQMSPATPLISVEYAG